jgi:hypothetical protein
MNRFLGASSEPHSNTATVGELHGPGHRVVLRGTGRETGAVRAGKSSAQGHVMGSAGRAAALSATRQYARVTRGECKKPRRRSRQRQLAHDSFASNSHYGRDGPAGWGTRPTGWRFCGGCRPGGLTRLGGDRAILRIAIPLPHRSAPTDVGGCDFLNPPYGAPMPHKTPLRPGESLNKLCGLR